MLQFGDSAMHLTLVRPPPTLAQNVNAEGNHMDLGITGRKAIVCASSRGLGKACARALAEAGCEV